ncbi:hypothetical protein [Zhongshania borealis]|uniref:Alpha/beta hydrolase n=1 Tax=Zhongshania borealis TaxID=889488 RepID=A0ABP7WG12_9GAMM
MNKQLVDGVGYQHVVYRKLHRQSQSLHIYIDGDGSPWLHGRYIAKDPSPKNPLALDLANLDTHADVVYLGRPCYLGLNEAPLCDESLWTSARYSAAVVRSMANAAQTIISEQGATWVSLIGYSGGGSLAMLMLEYMESVDELITVAANLDIDRWTAHHGYLPLHRSLNPMTARYPSHIRYRHFAGADDKNIPLAQTRLFVAKHGGELTVIPDFTHSCCWAESWPALIQ